MAVGARVSSRRPASRRHDRHMERTIRILAALLPAALVVGRLHRRRPDHDGVHERAGALARRGRAPAPAGPHAAAGGADAAVARRRDRARPADLHPGVGDPAAGTRPRSPPRSTSSSTASTWPGRRGGRRRARCSTGPSRRRRTRATSPRSGGGTWSSRSRARPAPRAGSSWSAGGSAPGSRPSPRSARGGSARRTGSASSTTRPRRSGAYPDLPGAWRGVPYDFVGRRRGADDPRAPRRGRSAASTGPDRWGTMATASLAPDAWPADPAARHRARSPAPAPIASAEPTPTSAPASAPATAESVAPAAEDPVGIEHLDHLVFIVQENRSFDHYFGTYPGADGLPRDARGPDHGLHPEPVPGPLRARRTGPTPSARGAGPTVRRTRTSTSTTAR